MIIDIRYPFSIRGVFKTGRAEKYIHATYIHHYDLPFIDENETEVVLTSEYAYPLDARTRMFDWGDPASLTKRASKFVLRKHAGKFYRRYCAVSDVAERVGYRPRDPLGEHKFPFPYDALDTEGLMTNFAWFFETDALLDPVHAYMARDNKRDAFRWVTWIDNTFPPFHQWEHTLSTYRAEDLNEQRQAYEQISNRIVAIGEDIWIECDGPRILVETIHSDHGDLLRTYLRHTIPNRLPLGSLRDQHFSLECGDEALDYARRYAEPHCEIVDLRQPLDIVDENEVSFDHRHERVWRQAQLCAVHCHQLGLNGKGKKLATTDAEKETILAAMAEADKFSLAFETRGEPEKYVRELTDMALRFDRKWFPGFEWGGRDKTLRKKFLAETIRMYDDRPINLYDLWA